MPEPPTGLTVRPFRHDDGPAAHVLVQLRHSFRAFHQTGRRFCTLWTYSDTGALDLYLRVGMTVRHGSTVLRKDLRTQRPRQQA